MIEAVGLDIGSYAIKLVSLDKRGSSYVVEQIGSAYNPVGQFLPQGETNKNNLAAAVKALLAEHKLQSKPLAIALPESDAYTSIISIPSLTDAELASAVQWEAEQHLPVSLADVNLEYTVLSRPDKGVEGAKMKLLLVAARKDLITRLTEFVQQIGSEVINLETASLALSRVYQKKSSTTEGSILICHLGALSTDIIILSSGSLQLTHSIPTGGLALTRAVEKGLSLDPSQAEEYKRTYGLDENQLEGRVRNVLIPILNSILTEVRKTAQYFQSEHPDKPVREVILSGGGAHLPSLAPYMANTFGTQVSLGNPLENFVGSKQGQVNQETAAFAVAVGLAAKEE